MTSTTVTQPTAQVDPTARVIWAFERLGWVSNVRWPVAARFDARPGTRGSGRRI